MTTTMTSVTRDRQQAGRALWLRWMLLFTALVSGWTLATTSLARPVLTQAIRGPLAREILILLGLAVMLAAFGAVHSPMLRPYLAQAAQWGAATAAALWVGGSLIEIGFASGSGQALGLAAGGLLLGPACATLQYFILRRQVKRAGWWVLAGTMGWLVLFGVAVAVAVVVQSVFNVTGDSVLFVYYGIGALVSGALTGGVLVWLLRQGGRPHDPR